MLEAEIGRHRTFTKSEINRLGERLKTAPISVDDLVLLNDYRNSFYDAAEFVQNEVLRLTGVSSSSRPSKTNESIISKLKRLESTRLAQIQDIAGIRLIVDNLVQQDRVRDLLTTRFTGCKLIDRREKPSHGYRAVHLVIQQTERLVEIQIRTELQHLWAQSCEFATDNLDENIKYGEGSPSLLEAIYTSSVTFHQLEKRIAAEIDNNGCVSKESQFAVNVIKKSLNPFAEKN